ncbi:MAG: hypothetical protein BA863_11305 [Desulfovibrio sp. S3730MH75]|nr:MAG: hypothetical protein BA863_11305 [Desulfovibrio sp. S3730MH75]
MIILTATIQASKGKEKELEKALLYMVTETAKEERVLEYRFHKSTNNSGSFLFYEKYSDQEIFDAHANSPHFKSTVKKISDMLAAEPIMTTYEFIAGIPESN